MGIADYEIAEPTPEEIAGVTPEETEMLSEEFICSVDSDKDTRKITITIAKRSPAEHPGMITAAQKEEMIIDSVRRLVRKLL